MIGYAFCGSFCTLAPSLSALKALIEAGEDVLPIISEKTASTDTRFFEAADFLKKVTDLCGRKPIQSIVDAEPLGPKTPLDALIISPCTGNTLAKIAQGITDATVPMATKAHLRCDRPTLIALASNDSLSAGLKNIAALLSRKQVYFVPMRQDDPLRKPHSLVADFTQISEALEDALAGRQRRPLFL